MKHSKNFTKYRMYYKMRIYDDQMIGMLVESGALTADEYKAITGKVYVDSQATG